MNGPRGWYVRFVKRALDFVFALALLAATLPIGLLAALAVAATSAGGALFRQRRVGLDYKPFRVAKFRTLRVGDNPPPRTGVELDAADPRITPVGRFLRRTKIDEWPQLWNIVKGDMSFVGPRPLLPDMLQTCQPWERERFAVRPGLTGLAQVNGGVRLDPLGRSYYDVRYAREASPLLDLRILAKTLPVVLFGEQRYWTPVDEDRFEALHRGAPARPPGGGA